MSLKVSHILTVYTLERGSLPFCGCSLEPDVEALPRMEACVRGVWLGRPPSQPAPPHGMPMLPAACRTSEAPRHECPNSLCQPFHAWGRGANTRSGTYCWEQVQQPRHNPRAGWRTRGFTAPRVQEPLERSLTPTCLTLAVEPQALHPRQRGLPWQRKGHWWPRARGLARHSLHTPRRSTDSADFLARRLRQPHLLGGQAPRKGLQSIPVYWPGLPATTETLISILIALLLSQNPTFRDL